MSLGALKPGKMYLFLSINSSKFVFIKLKLGFSFLSSSKKTYKKSPLPVAIIK